MIIDIGDGNRMFARMNSDLIDSYTHKKIDPSVTTHRHNFERTYRVKIKVKNNRWFSIEFDSEQEYLATVMKWSC